MDSVVWTVLYVQCCMYSVEYTVLYVQCCMYSVVCTVLNIQCTYKGFLISEITGFHEILCQYIPIC